MAKNIFGVRDDAEQIDGQAFVLRQIPAELKEKMERFGQDAEAFAEEYRPSRRLALLRTFALVTGVVLLIIARMQGNEAGVGSFGALFRAYPVSILASFALLGVAIGLVAYERVRAKKAGNSEAADRLRDRSDAIDAEAYSALGVPENAISLDLLTSSYRVQNGVEKNTVHTAFAFRAWVADGCLCLADVENVVGIPLDSIAGLTRVERRVTFYFWNKKEPPRSEAYRQYRIRSTYLGAYTVKGVSVMHIQSEFGEYELLVPPYETEAFLNLTGKRFPPENEKEKV